MRFCVIMPLFNQRPELLEQAITSALWQDYPDTFHLRVFLDGADQATRDVLRKVYEKSGQAFTVHSAGRPNRGIAYTLNEAHTYIEQHRPHAYDAITWVSSDNLHYPQMLAGLARGFASHERVAYVLANNHRYDPHTHTTVDPILSSKDSRIRALADNTLVWPRDFALYGLNPCFAYRAKYARLKYDTDLEFAEDLEFFVRLHAQAAAEGRVGARSSEHLFRYLGSSSHSHSAWLDTRKAFIIQRMGVVYWRYSQLWPDHFKVEWVDVDDPEYADKAATWAELPPLHRFLFVSCPAEEVMARTEAAFKSGRIYHGFFPREVRHAAHG